MKDLSIIRLTGVLPYRKVDVVESGGLEALSIEGSDMANAVEVVINGLQSPSVAAVSLVRTIAQIPSILKGKMISSVEVRSRKLSPTTNRMNFSFLPAKSVSGLQRLIQRFTLLLMRSSRTGVLNSKLAVGNLMSLIGRTFTSDDEPSRIISQAVSDVADGMRRTQNSLGPLEEQLDSATVQTVSWVPTTGNIAVSISLKSKSGKSAQFLLDV